MPIRPALRRPVPAPRRRPLARLAAWLLEDTGAGLDRSQRALVAALLRAAPPR